MQISKKLNLFMACFVAAILISIFIFVNNYTLGIIIFAAVSIVSFIGMVLISGKISKNINAAYDGVKLMGAGDLSARLEIKSKDEIGLLADELNVLAEILENIFKSMRNSSNKGVELKESLSSVTGETSAAATEIASNSQAISKQFQILSEHVEGAADANDSLKISLQSLEEYVQDQISMVEVSTSSVTEMISSINNVADITSRKRQATDVLVKTALSGGEKLDATIKVINEINESLDQIKGTATIIQQIASQTNLLAMNAAIEAAHAGESGRGFAVVADEIRKLAEASSHNSKQISGVLKDVVTRIEAASISGHETEAAFNEIDREVKDVAQSLDEINSSMGEINVGGSQILEAMTGLQDVSMKVSQGSAKMMESFNRVNEANDIVSRITTEVANSANEITIGITEVSNAMLNVKEYSNKLGEITERIDKDSGVFGINESEVVGDINEIQRQPEPLKSNMQDETDDNKPAEFAPSEVSQPVFDYTEVMSSEVKTSERIKSEAENSAAFESALPVNDVSEVTISEYNESEVDIEEM